MRCTLERIRVRPTRRRNLKLVEGVVVDGEGVRETAVWFNQAYLAKLAPGTELLLHGSRELSGGFRVARTEVGGAGLHTVGLVPEYRGSEDLPSYRLRALVDNVLPRVRFLPDPLPARLRHEEGLPLRADALTASHRPRDREETDAAHRRLAFEELLTLQLGFRDRRRALEEQSSAPALDEQGELIGRYYGVLPFDADTGSALRRRRDRTRPRRVAPDAAPPPGGRRLREDRRGPLRAPARGRERSSGRADGARRKPSLSSTFSPSRGSATTWASAASS